MSLRSLYSDTYVCGVLFVLDCACITELSVLITGLSGCMAALTGSVF